MNDYRSRRIVYASLCILNQNVRFPGIAVTEGACHELVEMLTRHNLGIEPLPCLERLGWGGVARKDYFRWQPLMLWAVNTPWAGLARLGTRLWIYRYSLVCRREARKVADQMQDYLDAGYAIAGLIAMNDSPTDGVTQTIDLLEAPQRLNSLGFSAEVLAAPDITIMRDLIRGLCRPGTGIFISQLKQELSKRHMAVPIVGFDPWTDPQAQTRLIEQELGLRTW